MLIFFIPLQIKNALKECYKVYQNPLLNEELFRFHPYKNVFYFLLSKHGIP